VTVHLAADTAHDAADDADERRRLLDAIDDYETLVDRLAQPDRSPTDSDTLDAQLDHARDQLEAALDLTWAESDDPHAWTARQRARHLLDGGDPARYRDAPGLTATREIIAAVHERADQEKLTQTVARIILQPGRQDALAALTDAGWATARTQLTACSDRTWRAVSASITALRDDRRRHAREARDPWNTPVPGDIRAAARQVQDHLGAGWHHADLDHFDRYGGLGGDGALDAILTDGTRFQFATATELTSPQRILGRLQACRITGVDPDKLKGRALVRLAALVDAASVDVETDPVAAETTDWITHYTQSRAGEDVYTAVLGRGPFTREGLIYINVGHMVTWLDRGQSIKITAEQLQRRLRGIGAHPLPEPVKPRSQGRRASGRYWAWQPPAEDDLGDDGSQWTDSDEDAS
jgi:hypothetical protein